MTLGDLGDLGWRELPFRHGIGLAEYLRIIRDAAQGILDWDRNPRPQRPGRPRAPERPKPELVQAAEAILDALQALGRDAGANDPEGMAIDLLNVGAAYQRFCIRYVEAPYHQVQANVQALSAENERKRAVANEAAAPAMEAWQQARVESPQAKVGFIDREVASALGVSARTVQRWRSQRGIG